MSDTNHFFVRQTMLEAELPPASQRGLLKWLRENLFSGWINSILTLLAMAALFVILRGVLPWVFNGVWNAGSLADCRNAVLGAAGQSMSPEGVVTDAAGTVVPAASGACWAMIRERWPQYIYGFYPPDLYWRPTLTFGLLFVALAPVLYYGNRSVSTRMTGVALGLAALASWALGSESTPILLTLAVFVGLTALAWLAPTKLVWVTILYPAIGFFLLWGGSVWGPVGTLAGFGVMWLVYRLTLPALGLVMASVAGFIAACLWWMSVQTIVTTAVHAALPWGIAPVESDQFGGFLLSFVIGVTAIACSLPLGILLALGRRSDMFLIKTLSVGFIEFVRGVPLITMLFVASLLLQYFLPPETKFDLILRVVILVTLFSAAYIAEVIRGGLAALPKGQYEAADALGLDYWQAQQLIIMPQALKIAIPGIVSSFIGLFKDTTLVALVGLADPLQGITKIVRADINWKGIYWEPYLFVGLIFFVFCFGMSRYSMYLERKLKRDHR